MALAAPLSALDLILRGGGVALLLLLAGLMLRDQRASAAARFTALFAAGAAAYALLPVLVRAQAGFWAAPVLALAAGNSVVFWLFARSSFDDSFRTRPWHAAPWVGVVALDMVYAYRLEPRGSPWVGPALDGLNLAAVMFAALAIVQTLSTWRTDLVERRRRLRLFVVGAVALYIVLIALADMKQDVTVAAPPISLLQALGLMAIAALGAWSNLTAPADRAATPPPTRADQEPALRPTRLSPADGELVAALDRTMRHDRIYRQERLSIAELARRQALPEYRLRRLINQGLGHRNFNSFLNRYRIAEAKAALADPDQAEVPILTIALDSGFGSLGPFNRAFKAETGVTPSDFRKRTGGDGALPISASRISNSA
jgi:AraC-like DNA-binding protein